MKMLSTVAKCKLAMTSLPDKQVLVLSWRLILLTLWRHRWLDRGCISYSALARCDLILSCVSAYFSKLQPTLWRHCDVFGRTVSATFARSGVCVSMLMKASLHWCLFKCRHVLFSNKLQAVGGACQRLCFFTEIPKITHAFRYRKQATFYCLYYR